MIKIFDLVPGWMYAAAIVVLGALWSVDNSRLSFDLAAAKGAASTLSATLERERVERAEQALTEEIQARRREQDLQVAANYELKEKQDEINRIAGERDAALGELRKRPKRPTTGSAATGLSSPPGSGSAHSCTGAELHQEDAIFLVWEATRADELRADYDRIYNLYEKARAVSLEMGAK